MSAASAPGGSTSVATKAAGVVLATLATGQFLMALDTSVMNVAIAQVAEDVGTTVTGVQGAITAYTLVMAIFMIPGGKVGSIIGHKRAFMIGSIIYGCGTFTTALSQSLPVLLFGWSFLEGVGAALILPAIVALVAGNFPKERRPAVYGLIAASAAIAIAAGPLIGGAATTYASWRLVFAGEVVLVVVILVLGRTIADAEATGSTKIDVIGGLLSAVGLGAFVFGILRSGTWGWVAPKADAPEWFGLSPVPWLLCIGLFSMWLFLQWEDRVLEKGGEPLVNITVLQSPQLRAGLTGFFFQFLIQMGVFFLLPLYLSVALGLTAMETGVRIMPLSITLFAAAVGIPKLLPQASPRKVVRYGLVSMAAGILVLLAAIEPDAGAEIVTVPLLLVGFGMGALASQLGAVTLGSVPDSQSGEVGGLQNTVTNVGASIGTALVGSLLVATLTSSFLTNVQASPDIPPQAKEQATVQLSSGIPFISDADLTKRLEELGATPEQADAALAANADARLIGLKSGLTILAFASLLAMFFARGIPSTPVAGTKTGDPEAEPAAAT